MMTSFTNYPVLIADSMDPFSVSVAFRCELCGRVSRNLDHICLTEEIVADNRQSARDKVKEFFSKKTIRACLES